ncbi:MAG: DUF4349 domain-containing protein [Microbacteriaceae bacterium]
MRASLRTTTGAALAGAALVLLLAGCSASESFDLTTAPSAADERMGDPAAELGAGSEAESGVVADAATGTTDAGLTDREIVTTGSATITAEEPVEAADAIAELAGVEGGHVAERFETTATEYQTASASLTVRIPSARLDAFMAQLDELGRIDDQQYSRQDVTAEGQDLDARITALRTSVDRLLALLERAEGTDDLITIESTLSQRQGELESLEGQRRVLDDQVALSTVQLVVRGEEDAPTVEPESFLTGLSTGWGALIATGAGLLVTLGVLLPWLLLLGVLALVAVPLVRRLRARRAARVDAPDPVVRGPFDDEPAAG